MNGHEFEQTLGDSEGQGSLMFCSPWGCKELDTTEWLNNNRNCLAWASMIKMSEPDWEDPEESGGEGGGRGDRDGEYM